MWDWLIYLWSAVWTRTYKSITSVRHENWVPCLFTFWFCFMYRFTSCKLYNISAAHMTMAVHWNTCASIIMQDWTKNETCYLLSVSWFILINKQLISICLKRLWFQLYLAVFGYTDIALEIAEVIFLGSLSLLLVFWSNQCCWKRKTRQWNKNAPNFSSVDNTN